MNQKRKKKKYLVPIFILFGGFGSDLLAIDNGISTELLVDICEKKEKVCNILLTGLVQGLDAGAMVGGMAVADQLLPKGSSSIEKLDKLVNDNNSVFLGYCVRPDFTVDELRSYFIEYAKKKNISKKPAAITIINVLQTKFPLPCGE